MHNLFVDLMLKTDLFQLNFSFYMNDKTLRKHFIFGDYSEQV